MKKEFLFLLISVCVLCLSCKTEQASYTPYIQISYFYLNPVYMGDQIVGAEDTLDIVVQNGLYVIDSINVDTLGDKVTFSAAFGSYGNDLTAIRCNFDSTQLKMEAPSLQSTTFNGIFAADSELSQLQLEINPGYNYIAFPINYKALKSGVYQFELVVESDSKFSPIRYTFVQPVR